VRDEAGVSAEPDTGALERTLAGVLVALMGVAVVNVLWQVFSRFVLNDPSSMTEELARYLLIWISLLGGAYAVGRRLHPAIDLLAGSLAGSLRTRQWRLVHVTILMFAVGVMVVGGLRLVTLTLSLGQTSAAMGIPLGYVYLALPVSGAIISWYAALALWRGPA